MRSASPGWRGWILGWWLVVATLLMTTQPTLSESRPTQAESREVCAYVAKRGPAITHELIREGKLDANNDGIEDDVSVGIAGGTMAGEMLEFRPGDAPPESDPIGAEPDGFFEWRDYSPFGAGWLKRGRRVYTLYFDSERHRHAEFLGYIDATNVEHFVCDFDSIEHEHLRPISARHEQLCRRVGQHRIAYFPVRAATADEAERDIGLLQTQIAGWASADFANVGQAAPLVLLHFSSQAARGCDFKYYDVLEGDTPAEAGEAHDRLMKLQYGDSEHVEHRRSPTCDLNDPRWFEYAGQVYLEDHAWQDEGPLHEVKKLSGDRVEFACHGEFKVRWRVKSMWPHL